METLKPLPKSADRVLPDVTKILNSMPDADTTLVFAGRLREAMEKQKAAAKAVGMVKKQMINSGLVMEDFMWVFGKQDMEPEAVMDHFKRIGHYAQIFALPVGTQADLFNGPASAVSLSQQAFDNGRMRGLMGLSPDDQKYHPESDLGQEHQKGWFEGQAVNKEKFLDLNEQAQRAEADKAAAVAEKAKAKAEKAAKKVPKTESGESIQ